MKEQLQLRTAERNPMGGDFLQNLRDRLQSIRLPTKRQVFAGLAGLAVLGSITACSEVNVQPQSSTPSTKEQKVVGSKELTPQQQEQVDKITAQFNKEYAPSHTPYSKATDELNAANIEYNQAMAIITAGQNNIPEDKNAIQEGRKMKKAADKKIDKIMIVIEEIKDTEIARRKRFCGYIKKVTGSDTCYL